MSDLCRENPPDQRHQYWIRHDTYLKAGAWVCFSCGVAMPRPNHAYTEAELDIDAVFAQAVDRMAAATGRSVWDILKDHDCLAQLPPHSD